MRILKLAVSSGYSEVIEMRLHSGDVCPKTGTYRVINEDGKTLNSVFVGEGETMPPTQCSSCCYEFAE
mgnify:FL=1